MKWQPDCSVGPESPEWEIMLFETSCFFFFLLSSMIKSGKQSAAAGLSDFHWILFTYFLPSHRYIAFLASKGLLSEQSMLLLWFKDCRRWSKMSLQTATYISSLMEENTEQCRELCSSLQMNSRTRHDTNVELYIGACLTACRLNTFQ